MLRGATSKVRSRFLFLILCYNDKTIQHCCCISTTNSRISKLSDLLHDLCGIIFCQVPRLTKKGGEFKWAQECMAAFTDIKTAHTSAAILAYPHLSPSVTPFIHGTYASSHAIGTVLSQGLFDSKEHVISYGSRAQLQQDSLQDACPRLPFSNQNASKCTRAIRSLYG